MFSEQFLKRLGFTDFEHLDKSKRDSNRRLSAIVFVDQGCFTIRLVLFEGSWKVDRFLFEGDGSVYKKYFTFEPDLKSIVDTLFFMNEPPENYSF